jgi:hypothetical protein
LIFKSVGLRIAHYPGFSKALGAQQN